MDREADWGTDFDDPDKASCVTIHVFWRVQYPGQNVFNKRISKHKILPVLNRLEVGNDRLHLPGPRVTPMGRCRHVGMCDPLGPTPDIWPWLRPRLSPEWVKTGSPAGATECLVLGVKRKSISGGWRSAYSRKATLDAVEQPPIKPQWPISVGDERPTQDPERSPLCLGSLLDG